jgi:hypothetical protein
MQIEVAALLVAAVLEPLGKLGERYCEAIAGSAKERICCRQPSTTLFGYRSRSWRASAARSSMTRG